jgi:hypothetical protein
MNSRTWLVMSCGAAVVFCAVAASPATGGCPVDPGTPVAATVRPDAAAVPPDFWTPERMRQARGDTVADATTGPRVTRCGR